MGAAGMFVLFAEVFNVLVLVSGLALLLLGIEQSAMRKGSGIAGILQIPVLLYAMGCNHIIRKSFYSLSPEAEENRGAHKIKVFSKDVTEGFRQSEPVRNTLNTLTGMRPAVTSEAIVDAHWENSNENQVRDFGGFLRDARKIQTGKDYDNLAREIAGKEEKIIVMAGASPADLPVTIPVNVAMRLAKSGKKVLLTDMDETREAIARVFNITNEQKGRICESCVRRLWVGYVQTEQIKASNFDFVIIYAPSELAAQKISDNRSISNSAGFIVYGNDKNTGYRICEMIENTDGKLY